MTTTPLYLQPGRIGSLEIPNRIVRGATSETMRRRAASCTTRSSSCTGAWPKGERGCC